MIAVENIGAGTIWIPICPFEMKERNEANPGASSTSAKAKTINKISEALQSKPHWATSNIPLKVIGVDLQDGTFPCPNLIVIPGKEKVVERLAKAAKECNGHLAPDPGTARAK